MGGGGGVGERNPGPTLLEPPLRVTHFVSLSHHELVQE